MHKYSVSYFNEISSIDSTFDTLNKFYKDLKKLERVRSQTEKKSKKKITVLKNVSLPYDGLISIYGK